MSQYNQVPHGEDDDIEGLLDNKDTNDQMNKLQEENTTLKKENTTLKKEETALKEVNSTLKEFNATLKEFNATLKEFNSTLKEFNATLKEHNATLKEHNATSKEDNAALKKENTTLKNQVNTDTSLLKSKKKVQILDSIQTMASAKFATTLETKLKSDFDCLMKNTERLENDIPLTIVCLNNTRLKPDIEQAMENVTYSAQCVVLIVHTGTESNLPVVSSSEKLSGFQRKVEFIDMGFDVDYGGIYNCQHNERALRRLREYIKTFD